MSNRDLEPTVRQSVLDRLIDTAPSEAADPTTTWSDSVRRLRIAVQRDLEWLLNTRRIILPAGPEHAEVQNSVYHYGLPDVTSLSGDSPDTPMLLARQMEACIEMFEPRLAAVRVTTGDLASDSQHRLRFVIEALLKMEPDPERVTFDTVLEVTSGDFEVTGTSDA
jgi:type VI secretion system protein ImpF